MRRRVGFLLLLSGIVALGVSGVRITQSAKALDDYEELVGELDGAPRVAGQPNAGLDHARSALASLREAHSVRWRPGGYMFGGAAGGLLGLGLCAAGVRLRTA